MTLTLNGKYSNLREYIKQLEGWHIVGEIESDLVHSTITMEDQAGKDKREAEEYALAIETLTELAKLYPKEVIDVARGITFDAPHENV